MQCCCSVTNALCVLQLVMHHQGMQHHQAGVVDHVVLAEMQHLGMYLPEMDLHAGLGLLLGVMPLLTGMHHPGGTALLHPSGGKGKHPPLQEVAPDGRRPQDTNDNFAVKCTI